MHVRLIQSIPLQIAKYLRHHLEDVLVKYGVDVVASGHLHAYSRTCPVIDRHCLPHEMGSVLHVVAGSGGRRLTEVGGVQNWLEHSERTFGFSRFAVRTLLSAQRLLMATEHIISCLLMLMPFANQYTPSNHEPCLQRIIASHVSKC